MTDIDALLERIAYRFLGWKLPEDFQPDCGIEFDRDKYVRLNPQNRPFEPVGTNLFSFTQATAMVKAIAGPEIEAFLDAITTERAKVAALEAEVKIAEAKGWRDAVTCVQYCKTNWSQDCRSEAERNALEDAAEELVNELVAASPGDWLGAEWKTAQDYSDMIASLENKLEPGARNDGNEPVQAALESIAISLKRIAGQLDGLGGTDRSKTSVADVPRRNPRRPHPLQTEKGSVSPTRYRIIQNGKAIAECECVDPDAALREIMHYAKVYAQDGPLFVQAHNGRRWFRYTQESGE